MANRKIPEKTVASDALAIDIRIIKPEKVEPERELETDGEYVARMLKNENRFLEGLSFYVIKTLDDQIAAARDSGASDRKINAALKGLFRGERNDLGIGKSLHYDARINALALHKGLDGADVSESNISIDGISKKRKEMERVKPLDVEPNQIRLFFQFRYGDLLDVPVEAIRKNGISALSIDFEPGLSATDTLTRLANAASQMDSLGIDIMGNYVREKNDCFVFCKLLLKNGLNMEWKDYGENRTVETRWFSTKNQDAAIAEMKNSPGCFVRVGSPVDSASGEVKNEHWAYFYRTKEGDGMVVDYNGTVRRMSDEQFLAETKRKGRIIISLNAPVSKRESARQTV